MYTIYDTDTNLDTYVLLNYPNIQVSSAKHTTVTCEFAESESVSELEKLFVMYDYYTDGLLADADYLIVDNSEFVILSAARILLRTKTVSGLPI